MTKRRLTLVVFAWMAAAFLAYTLLFWPLPTYHYSSSDGGFTDIEVAWKGRHFDFVKRRFETYRKEGHPDAFLIINSEKSWRHPKLWIDNLTHDRWKLPYRPKPGPSEAGDPAKSPP